MKHAMFTKRVTNPLTPVYQSLDHGKPIYNLIEPLLPAEIIKKPLILIGVDEKGEAPSTLSSEAKKEAKKIVEIILIVFMTKTFF